MGWRGWVVFTAAGSAGAFGYRGDWLAAAGITVAVAAQVAWWVRRRLLATRAALRSLDEMVAVAGSHAKAPRPARNHAAGFQSSSR